MSDTQKPYTPGPWHVISTSNHQGLVISDTTHTYVAITYDEKDAPLVALAPTMHEALVRIADLARSTTITYCNGDNLTLGRIQTLGAIAEVALDSSPWSL